MKTLYILTFLLVLVTGAQAQSLPIAGYLRDSITHLPVAGGTLVNANSQQTARTDSNGFFRLQAAPNDVIYAMATAYHHDTLRYAYLFTDTLNIYLAPSGDILPNVTVAARYNKYQLDSIERRTAFEEVRVTPLPAVSANNNGAFGVGINLDRFFKKRYKNAKGEEQAFNRHEQEAYVAYRFSPQLVAYYTGLKGDALRNFMRRNTPSYKWLRQNPTNDDVLFYINDRLKAQKAAAQPKTF